MHSEPRPSSIKTVAMLIAGVSVVIGILVSIFAWTPINSEPDNLPIAIAGPPEAIDAMTTFLNTAAGSDSFSMTEVATREDAVEAISNREVYGAIVVTTDGSEMLTASAASPAVAQLLTQLARALPAEAGGPLLVTDVVPQPAEAAGLPAIVLPLVMGGIISAVLGFSTLSDGRYQLATTVGISLAGGFVVTAILQWWLGAIEGSAITNMLILALGIAAIGTVTLGLGRLLGYAGIGIVSAAMMLLGNPFSAVASAPEMLPAGLGVVGQLMPPGAAGTALRSASWFGNADSGFAWTVLIAWVVVGVALCILSLRRSPETGATEPAN